MDGHKWYMQRSIMTIAFQLSNIWKSRW